MPPIYGPNFSRRGRGSRSPRNLYGGNARMAEAWQSNAAKDYSDPYGRPTTGYGFGRGGVLPNLDSTVTGGNTFAPAAVDSSGAASTGGREFAASTETIVDNSANRARLMNALRLLGSQNITDAERARMQAEAGVSSALRNAFAQSQATREELSAAGLGYSPRFAGRAQRAIVQDAANQAAGIDANFRAALAGLQRRLQTAEVDASGDLSERELDEATEASGNALREILAEGLFKAREEGRS